MSKEKPFQNCPRWERCAVNRCPLHPDYLRTLKVSEYDLEQKCTMEKRVRKRIAALYGLTNQGLTQRELSSQKLWDSQTEEQKQTKIKKLQELSPIARLSKKGYTIHPKRKDRYETHTKNNKDAQIQAQEGHTSEQDEGGE